MRIKRISGALLIALVFHIIVVFLIGIRLDNQELHTFKDLVGVETFEPPDPPKPNLRKPIVKYTMSPPNAPVPTMVTHANLSTSNSPSSLAYVGPTPQSAEITADLSNINLNTTVNPLSSANIPSQRQHLEARVENVGVVRDGLGYVAESITLGNVETPPLPKGEPGGVIIVKTKAPIRIAEVQPQMLNPPNGAAFDDVFYKNFGTNPFIDTEDDNFSTFGMDVDTASYSVMRRYLLDELLPPPGAVRVEEFVNAFDYNYAPPTEDAFAVHIEGAPSKFGEGKRLQLLRIGIQGRVIPDADRKDAILTFVIDVSGSMSMENRLGLVKNALTLLVEQLRPSDKVGIVVYGSNARIVLPHTGIENREYIGNQ